MDTIVAPWDRIWDVVVVGTGIAGLAAAHAASADGRDCLLLGPDGDLAWEVGRGLAPAGAGDGGGWLAAWRRWQADRGTPPGDHAQGELAAHALLSQAPRTAWLGYAPVVAVEAADGLLTAVIVAAKQGLRRIRSRCWVDASADGLLVRLLGATPPPAPTTWVSRWLLVQATWPTELPPLPGAAWEPGAWAEDRVLVWRDADPLAATVAAPARLAQLRAVYPGAAVAVLSERPLPVHDNHESPPTAAANLACAVPGWIADSGVVGLAIAGEAAAAQLLGAPAATVWCEEPPAAPTPARQLTCGVLVAGLGTSGAEAALAAAEHGGDVIACDPAWLPGGMGTGGLISGYCAGAEGGRGLAIDRAAAALPFGPDGRGGNLHGWHPQAKATALAVALHAAGVRVLPGTAAYAVQRSGGRIVAVDLAAPDGPLRIAARAVVDATGDGGLCLLAGAEATGGSRLDGGVLAYTQSARVLKPDLTSRGTNCDCGWVDATDSVDLTRARSAGVRLFAEPAPRPGEARPLALAPLLGLRQSRHLAADATVTLDDLAAGSWPDDAVGPCATFLDTHASDIHLEDDEVVVWLLVLRAFRARIGCGLPYRMLLPRGLDNAWIACRAAGMTPAAAYGLRMQRDLQRLGEAAGIAAALAPDGEARAVDGAELCRRLAVSGALVRPAPQVPEEPLAVLDRGEVSAAVWPLYARWPQHAAALRARLGRDDRTGWLAATLLAARGDAAAEPRLLAAIATRQLGPEPGKDESGAFGQRIVLPDWALAAVLLRCCGTAACLPALATLADGDPPFDLRSLLLATVERLAVRLGPDYGAELTALADRLASLAPAAARLPPSRSVWRRLLGQPDPPLPHVHHAAHEDLGWQLVLLRGRVRAALDVDPDVDALHADGRGHVRAAAAALFSSPG